MTKPVELMNEDERKEYYLQRRKAILAGDEGVLPDGRTCKEAREAYAAQCQDDPFKTLPGVAGVAAIEGSELPITMPVAPEIESTEGEQFPANARCC